MKTKLLALIASVLLTHFAMAQFHVGVKAGTNISKIEGRSFKDEFRYGYLAGGFAEIGLGGRLAIQPEVLFNQYRTRVDSSFRAIYENAFNPSYNNDVKLNYISIPLLLNYKVGSLLTLQAGPQFSILRDQNKTLLQNGRDAFDKGDFSMVGGAQLKISKLRLSGRYVVGLNNINDIDNRDKWKSQAWQLAVGFAL
ncbi:MAG: PorT family protein [Flavisolibacter sp.]|nr:PorT family protein [Flavisolibacter sp.]